MHFVVVEGVNMTVVACETMTENQMSLPGEIEGKQCTGNWFQTQAKQLYRPLKF